MAKGVKNHRAVIARLSRPVAACMTVAAICNKNNQLSGKKRWCIPYYAVKLLHLMCACLRGMLHKIDKVGTACGVATVLIKTGAGG